MAGAGDSLKWEPVTLQLSLLVAKDQSLDPPRSKDHGFNSTHARLCVCCFVFVCNLQTLFFCPPLFGCVLELRSNNNSSSPGIKTRASSDDRTRVETIFKYQRSPLWCSSSSNWSIYISLFCQQVDSASSRISSCLDCLIQPMPTTKLSLSLQLSSTALRT